MRWQSSGACLAGVTRLLSYIGKVGLTLVLVCALAGMGFGEAFSKTGLGKLLCRNARDLAGWLRDTTHDMRI